MNHSPRTSALLALCVYLLALLVRVWGIDQAAIVTDERFWVSRSVRVNHHLTTTPQHATTHLGHPGIPAAITMAFGMRVAGVLNRWHAVTILDPGFIDELDAARYANAVVSAAIGPILFWGLLGLVPLGAAFIMALLCSFDPHLIAAARMAHIDGVMVVTVAATFFCYFHGAVKKKEWLLLCAGVFWGLSIASKPTAVALIPTFLIFNLLLFLYTRKAASRFPLLHWSDCSAVLIGQLVFAAQYTRLWHHPSEYVTRLKLWSHVAGGIFREGRWLAHHSALWSAIVFALIVFASFLIVRGIRNERSQSSFYAGITTLLVAASVVVWGVVPAVPENIVRYWNWVLGLSHTEARTLASNILLPPLSGGYIERAWMHLPALVSIGALIGFVFVMHAWIRKKANFLALFFILASLLIGIWFVLLQESAKASWRYALPIVPYLYVFAAYGWWHFAKLVSFHRKMFAFALCGILSGCFCATVLSSYPQYFFFRSTVSGGLAYQARVGAGLPNFVVPEVLNAILAKARGYYGPHPFLVDLPGDAEIYRLALSMSAPDMIEKIGFGYFPAPERSMELWYTFLPPRKGAVKHDLCMEYSLKGEPLVALYD